MVSPPGEGASGGLIGKQFLAFFKANVGPMMSTFKKQAKGRDVVIVLDGAGVHKKKELKKWLEGKSASLMDEWAPHSPDLNPIENAWAHVKEEIGKELQIYDRKDEEASKKRIEAKRDAVVRRYAGKKCHNLVHSFRTRLQKCVELDGGHTGY